MVNPKNILVTGSNGQLGSSLKQISDNFPFRFFFKDKHDLNISDKISVNNFVLKENISCLINCAAFTNVEAAEINIKKAHSIDSYFN